MSNYDFAPWDITKMLPENKNKMFAIDYTGFIQNSSMCEELLKPHEYKIAWTWEDIRLYLLEKGYIYIVDIRYKALRKKDEYKGTLYSSKVDVKGHDFIETENIYQSFEEAREDAVKYCLELINNETI